MTGFDIYDRYDFVLSLLIGLAMAGALVLGAPLWAIALILFLGCVVSFIRHFDEINGPAAPPDIARKSHPERVSKHTV